MSRKAKRNVDISTVIVSKRRMSLRTSRKAGVNPKESNDANVLLLLPDAVLATVRQKQKQKNDIQTCMTTSNQPHLSLYPDYELYC